MGSRTVASRCLSTGGARARWSARGVWLNATETVTSDGAYRSGYIQTPHGVVGLYTQIGAHPHTALTFIAGGRQHRIWWGRTFTDRWLKTLARTFAEECSR
jgi:hypothetical protein